MSTPPDENILLDPLPELAAALKSHAFGIDPASSVLEAESYPRTEAERLVVFAESRGKRVPALLGAIAGGAGAGAGVRAIAANPASAETNTESAASAGTDMEGTEGATGTNAKSSTATKETNESIDSIESTPQRNTTVTTTQPGTLVSSPRREPGRELGPGLAQGQALVPRPRRLTTTSDGHEIAARARIVLLNDEGEVRVKLGAAGYTIESWTIQSTMPRLPYESLDALLIAISPSYVQAMSEELMRRFVAEAGESARHTPLSSLEVDQESRWRRYQEDDLAEEEVAWVE